MFSKPTMNVRNGKLYCISTKSVVPEDVPLLDHCMFELLHQVIVLIADFFKIAVEARFHNSYYSCASIVILKGYYEEVVDVLQHKEVIRFLKNMGGMESTKLTAYDSLWKNTIVMLHTRDLVRLKEKIESFQKTVSAGIKMEEGGDISSQSHTLEDSIHYV